MWATIEDFQNFMRDEEENSIFFEVDLIALTRELFAEDNTCIQGVDFKEIQNECFRIYHGLMKDWKKDISFKEFVEKEIRSDCLQFKKLLKMLYSLNN